MPQEGWRIPTSRRVGGIRYHQHRPCLEAYKAGTEGRQSCTLDSSRTLPGAVVGVHRKWGHVYELHVPLHLQPVRLRPDDSFEDSGVRTVTGFALPEGTLPRITTARWQWLPLRGKPAPPAM